MFAQLSVASLGRRRQAKADIVVTVRWIVVVTVGGSAVDGTIVPVAATFHTVGASMIFIHFLIRLVVDALLAKL